MPVFRKYYFLSAATVLLLTTDVSGQDSVWTLKACLQYAKEHNLSIQENEINLRVSEMTYRFSKVNHIPNLSLSSNYGASFGRSINPTTNQFENTQFSSLGLSVGSNVLLFGWFQKHYTIRNNGLRVRQAEHTKQQVVNEMAMNVSTAYLRALLAKEQISNVAYQLEISLENKNRMERLLEAGRSNILEVSQAQAQMAADSGIYYQALLNYEQALIELKAILNLDLKESIMPVPVKEYEHPFYIEKTDPEAIYIRSEDYSPDIANTRLGITIAEREIKIAKANSLPSLNMYFSTGTNYSSSFYELLPNGERQLMNFGRQLNNNLSQSFGLGLSVPVFNGFSYRSAIQNAKYSLEKARITNLAAKQQLRRDIYTAYTDYEITLKRYRASESAAKHAETSFNAATVRFENGLIAHFEYLTEKNNFLKAQNETTALKYDLQFKKMLVDYYIKSEWPAQ